MLVQNKMASLFEIVLQGETSIFLENPWELNHRGHLYKVEMFQIVLKMYILLIKVNYKTVLYLIKQ